MKTFYTEYLIYTSLSEQLIIAYYKLNLCSRQLTFIN